MQNINNMTITAVTKNRLLSMFSALHLVCVGVSGNKSSNKIFDMAASPTLLFMGSTLPSWGVLCVVPGVLTIDYIGALQELRVVCLIELYQFQDDIHGWR